MNIKTNGIAVLLISLLSASPASTAIAAGEFPKGWEPAAGISETDKHSTEQDRFRTGGTLSSELWYFRGLNPGPGGAGSHDLLMNPNWLWLYFDAQMRQDVRVYGKGRLIYDPMQSQTAATSGGASSATAGTQITGVPAGQSQSSLEELKLFFNFSQTVFFTVGKQKIKWGSGRFWNPTDLINSTRRNFLLSSDDRRLGVSLLKAHVPVGAANLYLVEIPENLSANSFTVDQLGQAARIEIPFSASELALSAIAKKGQKPGFGIDISTAVSTPLLDLDLYSELGSSRSSGKNLNWMAGASYEFKYSDSDTATLSFEYFLNNDGYRNTADYARVFSNQATQAYIPFYLGHDYGLIMLTLPNPGRWLNHTFALMHLTNFSDHSSIVRLSALFTTIRDLRIDTGIGIHYGSPDGEFKMGNQTADGYLRLQVDF